MNNKQTAVQWLVEQMIERKFFAKDTPLSYTTLEHLTNQAKEMEKQQSLRDYSHGVKDAITDINSVDCNRYYNEEYGKR